MNRFTRILLTIGFVMISSASYVIFDTVRHLEPICEPKWMQLTRCSE